MANNEQLALLKQGVEVWNQWREEHANENVDLIGADLHGANLERADLYCAILSGANLYGANLREATLNRAFLVNANLCGADLQETDLTGVNFCGANLSKANLHRASLIDSVLIGTNLTMATMSRVSMIGVALYEAKLREVDLSGAYLSDINLSEQDLYGANLRDANLCKTNLVGTNLSNAILTGAKLYGTARDDWKIKDILCDYVFWENKPDFVTDEEKLKWEVEHRFPKNRDFHLHEFEDRYKHLPTFDYFFENGLTLFDEIVMNRIVEVINQRHSDFKLDLVSFDKRGQPHATFTVQHKEYKVPALQQITMDYLEYEKCIAKLKGEIEGKNEQILAQKQSFSEVIEKMMDKLLNRPQLPIQALQMFISENLTTHSIGGSSMNGTKQIIGNNFESGGGNMNIAQDQATANQTNYSVAPSSSVKELLQLLADIQQELPKLSVSEDIKAEALNEVKGAEIQAQKSAPDKTKIADKLKNAGNALKEAGALGSEAIGLGTAIGKAILWCGERWAF